LRPYKIGGSADVQETWSIYPSGVADTMIEAPKGYEGEDATPCSRCESTTEPILTAPHSRHRHWSRTWAVSDTLSPRSRG